MYKLVGLANEDGAESYVSIMYVSDGISCVLSFLFSSYFHFSLSFLLRLVSS
jgi:hypothetical protein